MLTKALLVVALIAGSASVATAQNTSHRHPAHSAAARTSAPVLQQRDVSLPSAGSSVGPFWYSWSGPTTGGL